MFKKSYSAIHKMTVRVYTKELSKCELENSYIRTTPPSSVYRYFFVNGEEDSKFGSGGITKSLISLMEYYKIAG